MLTPLRLGQSRITIIDESTKRNTVSSQLFLQRQHLVFQILYTIFWVARGIKGIGIPSDKPNILLMCICRMAVRDIARKTALEIEEASLTKIGAVGGLCGRLG
jgi:hypothetical protein